MTITKPTEAVHCRLCKTEMKVDGLLYYCKETNCDTFPVCDLCLCHDCGRCDLCCTCIEQEVWAGGNLYCFTCGSVEYHALESEDGLATNADAICVKCKTTFGKDVSVVEIPLRSIKSAPLIQKKRMRITSSVPDVAQTNSTSFSIVWSWG